ncbi:MAG: DUF4189 domain-containing protein [Sphingopyxis sp.]|nr:DUF4189 domain-containing protein [Sphingopyxis sp.]
MLDAWVVGGVAGLGGEQFVKKAALDACTKAMGSGCTIYSWTMGHIVISRNNEGLLKVSDAATERGALAEARTGCDKQRQLPCEIMLRISARAKKHVPNLARNRRITASAAWLRLKPGETDLRVWIATGHSTFQAAQDAALAACQAQVVGRECDTAVNVSNGVLQTFRADEGRLGVVAESSKDRAKALALLNCKVDLSKECRLQTVYSSRTPGLFLHDYKTGRGTAI